MAQAALQNPKRPKLQARNVTVEYEIPRRRQRLLALDGVSLDVSEGEVVAIVGPSGCGKTTFLNAVDGLVRVTSGDLSLDGRPICGPGPDRAMVFQEDALLPWRTVLGNVVYGLELQRRVPRREALERGRQLISLVGLSGFENHYPAELSGGMRQRVNLARALALNPELLLLDEPFAALDAQTREFMQFELLKILSRARTTALMITHQIDEAIYLANRVIVFSARPGRVKEDLTVPLPRPRRLEVKRSPEFLAIEDHVWSLIEEEAVRTGMITRESEGVV